MDLMVVGQILSERYIIVSIPETTLGVIDEHYIFFLGLHVVKIACCKV